MVYEANTEYDADSLFHYGVVGMHWGIRRYQPYSYTDGRDYGESGREIGLAAKLGRGIKSAKNSIEAYKKTAKKKATLRKARRTKAAKAKAAEREEKKRVKEEKKKEELINSGDIDKVMKNKSKLTIDEIRRATDRIVAESKLRDIESEEALKAIERGKRLVSSVADMTRNVGSIYDTVSGLSRKMNEASEAARKKAEEKRMNDIIKTGDYEKINRAIERGELNPEKIKTAREVMQSRKLITEMGQQNRDKIEADHKRVEDSYKQEAEERYKRNVTDVVERSKNSTNAVKSVNDDDRFGKSTIKLTLDNEKPSGPQPIRSDEIKAERAKRKKGQVVSTESERSAEYKALVEKGLAEAKSRSAKKGWETRRKNESTTRESTTKESSSETASKSRAQELFERYQATLVGDASTSAQSQGQEAVSKAMKKKKKKE